MDGQTLVSLALFGHTLFGQGWVQMTRVAVGLLHPPSPLPPLRLPLPCLHSQLIQQEVQPGLMAGSRDELSWQTSGWWPGGAAGWTRGHLYSCTAATAVTDRCSSQQHCLLAGQWSGSWEPSSVRPQLSLSARPRPLARVHQCPPPWKAGKAVTRRHERSGKEKPAQQL